MSEKKKHLNEPENIPDFLKFIDQLNADTFEENQPLPTDFSQKLDHYLYPITFYPETEGGYTVIIQDLPGCICTGETLEDAMNNILDAKQQWLETALKYGDSIPLPSTLTESLKSP